MFGFATRAAALFIAAMVCAGAARAQAWPNRPVRFIMPLPTGSGADITARIYADRLSKIWGQPVVVENRPGADGVIAVSSFVKARDDHQLLFAYGGPISISPVITKDLPYDPAKDLAPITLAVVNVLAIAAPAAAPYSDLRGLADYARSHPGEINWTATPGLTQFLFAALLKGAGLDMAYVAYKEAGPGLQDLVENRIQINVTGAGLFQPLVRAGQLKLLAVTNHQRFPAAPEVPTVAEQGFPDIASDGFNGFFGPAGMSPETRAKIAADVKTVSTELAGSEKLANLGEFARADGPEAFRAMIEDQRKQVARIIADLGGVPGQ